MKMETRSAVWWEKPALPDTFKNLLNPLLHRKTQDTYWT